jgi:hypothetical protein
MKKKSILLGVVAITIAIGLVAAVVIYHFGFQQHFEVVSGATIEIWLDEGLTHEFHQGDTLNWGQITDSTPKNITLYIKDVGTVDATLQLGYDQNQLPGGQQGGWSLSLDYGSTPLVHGGESRKVNITLTMPSTIDAGMWDIGSEIRATPVS